MATGMAPQTVIVFNAVHSANTSSPIEITLAGMVADSRDEHIEKTLLPNLVNPLGKFTFFKFEQPSNALEDKIFRLGKLKDVRELQPAKAPPPINETFSPFIFW